MGFRENNFKQSSLEGRPFSETVSIRVLPWIDLSQDTFLEAAKKYVFSGIFFGQKDFQSYIVDGRREKV